MDTPVTRLDERFSDSGTEATTWAAAVAALEAAQVSWISTVRADGRPHVTPLVAVWLDGALHFSTGAEEQKGLNLAANPHVVLTTGRDSWDDGFDVMVEGRARRVTDPVALARLADAWRAKWDGRWEFEVTEGGFTQTGHESLVYAVHPAKVLAFGRTRLAEADAAAMLGDVAFTHTSHTP